jgi:hypothetical protein
MSFERNRRTGKKTYQAQSWLSRAFYDSSRNCSNGLSRLCFVEAKIKHYYYGKNSFGQPAEVWVQSLIKQA